MISLQYIRVRANYFQFQMVELAMHTSSSFHSPNWVTIHSMVFSSQSVFLGLGRFMCRTYGLTDKTLKRRNINYSLLLQIFNPSP